MNTRSKIIVTVAVIGLAVLSVIAWQTLSTDETKLAPVSAEVQAQCLVENPGNSSDGTVLADRVACQSVNRSFETIPDYDVMGAAVKIAAASLIALIIGGLIVVWTRPKDDELAAVPTLNTGLPLSRMLGGWVQALFWITAGSATVVAGFAYVARSRFNRYWSAPRGSSGQRALESWGESEDNYLAALGLTTLLSVVLLVLLIIWMYRAHRVTDVMGATDRRWSRGWTIGGWFVPVGNLLIPKLVLGEIERIGLSARPDGRVSTDWRKTPVSAKGWLWWVLWLGGVLLVQASGYLPDPSGSDVSYSGSVRTAYVLQVLGALAMAAGAVFGALYVRSIGSRLFSPTVMPWLDSAQSQGMTVGTSESTGPPTEMTQRAEPPAGSSPPTTANIAEALRELKALQAEGILTQDEYETKRQGLADRL